MNKATLAVLTALIFLVGGVVIAITLARGYKIDIGSKTLTPTGILVATSDPDGAEVVINGKLTTATNSTINLAPGKYTVRIQKDGYTSWEKQVEIKKEEVFKTNVFLFPSLSDLRPLTFTGSLNPTTSSDLTKTIYGVASASARVNGIDGNGVWVIDMGRSFLSTPIFFATDFRQIYRNTSLLPLSEFNFQWSPDSRQVLAYKDSLATPSAAYLLDTDRVNESPVSVTTRIPTILEEWNTLILARNQARLDKLPLLIKTTLASASAKLEFSPDETKVLYTATVSAELPKILTAYLPGTNPTSEARNLKAGNTYVYDLKEDKNFLVPNNVTWFPSSRHLLSVTNNQISVMEYDGTNKAAVFSGEFDPKNVFVWPNWSKIVILTSLGNSGGQENLYTINLR